MSSKKTNIMATPAMSEGRLTHALGSPNRETILSPKVSETVSKNIFSEKKLISPPKNKSFSDIIAIKDKDSKVIEIGLEQELDLCADGTLHAINKASQLFNESSIHKAASSVGHEQSSFDIKQSIVSAGMVKKEPAKLQKGNFRVEIPKNIHISNECIFCQDSKDIQKDLQYLIKANPDLKTAKIRPDDLINPCLCQVKAHRYCLKCAIITQGYQGCEVCKSEYSVAKVMMNEIDNRKKNLRSALITLVLCVLYIGGMVGVGLGLDASSKGDSSSGAKFAVTLVLIVFMIVMTGLYFYYLVKKYCQTKPLEIEVYCKQTEIGHHQENPIHILDVYLQQQHDLNKPSYDFKQAKNFAKKLSFSAYEAHQNIKTPKSGNNNNEKGAHGKGNKSPKALSQTFIITENSEQEEIGGKGCKDSCGVSKDQSSTGNEKKVFQKELFISSQDLEQSRDIETGTIPTISDFSSRIDEKNHVGNVPPSEYPTATKNIAFMKVKDQLASNENSPKKKNSKVGTQLPFSPRADILKITTKQLPQTEVNPQSPQMNSSHSRLISVLIDSSQMKVDETKLDINEGNP